MAVLSGPQRPTATTMPQENVQQLTDGCELGNEPTHVFGRKKKKTKLKENETHVVVIIALPCDPRSSAARTPYPWGPLELPSLSSSVSYCRIGNPPMC